MLGQWHWELREEGLADGTIVRDLCGRDAILAILDLPRDQFSFGDGKLEGSRNSRGGYKLASCTGLGNAQWCDGRKYGSRQNDGGVPEECDKGQYLGVMSAVAEAFPDSDGHRLKRDGDGCWIR